MLTNIYECLAITLRSWRSLCDHCELMANGIRKPIRHTFATGETTITFETPQNDRECLRTATNVWRSFAIITNSWRTAFVSPFAIYSPQCESGITRQQYMLHVKMTGVVKRRPSGSDHRLVSCNTSLFVMLVSHCGEYMAMGLRMQFAMNS